MNKRAQSMVYLLLAAVAAASMWFYVNRILRAHQIADAAKRQVPRGNLSDLYPRWWGTRELFLHGRNPYSHEVTLEIQEGYYGRRLDAARANDPKDQHGFAYPVYVVFLLAPLMGLPFSTVMAGFYWLLTLLTAGSVLLWLRVLRWKLGVASTLICVALVLGSFAAVQGIKLQQLSLLVAGLMAGAVACAAGGHLFIGGALLALATIKPQLAWALTAWMLLWAVSDWRERRRFVFGFGTVMALLLGGAEIVLPGWWKMFAEAVGRYHQYTQNQSVIEVTLNQVLGSVGSAGRVGAQILGAIAALACGWVLWKLREERASTAGFCGTIALILALTVLVVPMYAPYNQVLLLPAILLLVRDRGEFAARSSVRRVAYWAGVLIFVWQWAASLLLTVIYFLGSRERALDGWTWPFFATFALPVWVFALIFLQLKDQAQREPARVKTS